MVCSSSNLISCIKGRRKVSIIWDERCFFLLASFFLQRINLCGMSLSKYRLKEFVTRDEVTNWEPSSGSQTCDGGGHMFGRVKFMKQRKFMWRMIVGCQFESKNYKRFLTKACQHFMCVHRIGAPTWYDISKNFTCLLVSNFVNCGFYCTFIFMVVENA